MVQRNAARYVFQDFSHHSSPTSTIKELHWTAWNSVDSWLDLPWCTKSSIVSLTFRHTILQGLVAAVVISWHYNRCIAEWSHMKPASSQQQWFHGIDSVPQQWPHQIKSSNQIYSWHKIITCQQDTKAGNPALTDALETVRQKISKIHNATSSVINPKKKTLNVIYV